jgi:excisionase family DNA binding protein
MDTPSAPAFNPEDPATWPVFLSVVQAAQILNTGERAVRTGIERGSIAAVAVGKQKRIPRQWLRQQAHLGTASDQAAA